jgi:hypothetical protein
MQVRVDDEGDEFGVLQAGPAGQILELFGERDWQTNRQRTAWPFVVPTFAGLVANDLGRQGCWPWTAKNALDSLGVSHVSGPAATVPTELLLERLVRLGI